MATNDSLILCVLVCLCYVAGELDLPEGAPCSTKGLNGTCVNVYRCSTAAHIFLYANAGYDVDRLPIFPDVCSYKNNDIIVCCTDCHIHEEPIYRNYVVGWDNLEKITNFGVAARKCREYFLRLPYPCRGQGTVPFREYLAINETCYYTSYYWRRQLGEGGREAFRSEFPHMVLLGYGDDVDSAQWLCGGSVISERFILTAAHCTSTRALGSIKFAAAGILKRSDPKKYWKVYSIKRIIMHPQYSSPVKYHDIALLETETEIDFGNNILPACLDIVTDDHDYYGREFEAPGWGRLGHRKRLADTLQVMLLQRFDSRTCESQYPPHRHMRRGYDHETQMCSGSTGEVVIDTCEGDSGGPLQLRLDINIDPCQYTIVGVTSYGKDCGILGSAGMYTRVSYYVPWIESVVWPEETEARRNQ